MPSPAGGIRRAAPAAWRSVAAIGVAAAVLAGDARAAQDRSPFVGVNAHYLFAQGPPAAWDRHLEAMVAAGVTAVRYDARWDLVERVPPLAGVHRYDWRALDAVVGALARRRLRWLPIVDYSARWAGSVPGDWRSAPARAEDYAAYAAALATRYGRGGSFWRDRPRLPSLPVTSYEIWNEPNTPAFWRPYPDPARYADLYLAARRALLGADPRARVVVGGLTGDGAPAYLRAMLSARPAARGRMDAVALHPYDRTVAGVLTRVARLRAALDAEGQTGTPIDVTEIGWPERGRGWLVVPDAARRERLDAVVTTLSRSNCLVSRVVIHTWTSPRRDPADAEQWFGLYRPDATPTAAAAGLKDALGKTAEQPPPSMRLPVCRPALRPLTYE